MLVVIAIIAILASMLLPALSQAKEQGKNAVCVSQEKQLALATIMYADDFDSTIPVGYNNAVWGPNDNNIRIANKWYWPHRILPYLANAEEVFDCPTSMKYPVINTYTANGGWNMFNLPPDGPNAKSTKLGQVVQPTRVPFFWEQTAYDLTASFAALDEPLFLADVQWGWHLNNLVLYVQNSGRHFRGGGGWGYDNIVFVDGHVRTRVSMERLAGWLNNLYYYSYPFTFGFNNPQVLPPDSEFHTYFGN